MLFTIHFATINTEKIYIYSHSFMHLQYTLLLLILEKGNTGELISFDLQYTLLLLILKEKGLNVTSEDNLQYTLLLLILKK